MYDFIVIGGISRLDVSRLSEDPDSKVLLLEAGPRDWNPYIHMPNGSQKTTKGSLTWGFELAPQKHQNGITPLYPQGRVLGGSSSINAQVYIRGSAADYDGAVRGGIIARCCSTSSVQRATSTIPADTMESRDRCACQSALYPSARESLRPGLSGLWSALQSGLQWGTASGAGLYQVTNHNGRRCSAAVAYLRPARGQQI